jgi:molecular chaperone GrpE
MLEVLDNYDRAFAAVKPDTDEERAIEARYKENYDKILNIFAELGITEVDTVGKEFDYEFHQAVMQRPSEYDEGIVCEELQKGFVLNGQKLIRAAMVSVSA